LKKIASVIHAFDPLRRRNRLGWVSARFAIAIANILLVKKQGFTATKTKTEN
jgi:hypothetical protein